MKKCLNCGYERQEKDDQYGIIPSTDCPKCGAIYEKVEKYLGEKERQEKERKEQEEREIEAQRERYRKHLEESERKGREERVEIQAQQEKYRKDLKEREKETQQQQPAIENIGWFKKKIIEATTKRIIQKISKQVHLTFQLNPLLSLGEVLIEINNKRGVYLPDEENMITDLYSLFSAMVYKAYLYERSHDPEALSKYNLELVMKITYDYMHMMMQNSGLPLPVSEIGEIRETGRDGGFIAYNNWTVLDTRTNLMWAAKDNRADIVWLGAKIYCEDYKGGGYTDWRMPTQDELAGLFDACQSRPVACIRSWSIHVVTELIDITGCSLWASETRDSEAAYFSYVFDGGPDWDHRSSECYSRALPVRSGK